MQIPRRPVLLGLAASAAAMTTPRLAGAAIRGPAGRPSTTVLLTGGAHDDAFLAGVAAAARAGRMPEPTPVRLDALDAGGLARLKAAFSAGPAVVVGLTDDASAAVIGAVARSAGAAQLWSGHHGRGRGAGDAWAARLGFALAANGRPDTSSAPAGTGRYASLASFSYKL
ncbi:MAG: hypothetical protein WDM92_03310 [Caulobacteraceae bacterium]